MASYAGIVLLTFILGTLAAVSVSAYPRGARPVYYRDHDPRAYQYTYPDSFEPESRSVEDGQGAEDELFQLIPVQRDPRSAPAGGDNAIVVPAPFPLPRHPIMMAGPRPRPSSSSEEMDREMERDLEEERERARERDYLYAAPTNYEPVQAATGNEHGHYDYVDYGAYTGGHGAFGWYSDHPVYVQSSGGSYRR